MAEPSREGRDWGRSSDGDGCSIWRTPEYSPGDGGVTCVEGCAGGWGVRAGVSTVYCDL